MESKQYELNPRHTDAHDWVNSALDFVVSTIVVILATPVGRAVGFSVGMAATKLGDVDGPPGAVALILSIGFFGLLFGLGAFLVCLKRYRTFKREPPVELGAIVGDKQAEIRIRRRERAANQPHKRQSPSRPVCYCVACGARWVFSAASAGRRHGGAYLSAHDRGVTADDFTFSCHRGLAEASAKYATIGLSGRHFGRHLRRPIRPRALPINQFSVPL